MTDPAVDPHPLAERNKAMTRAPAAVIANAPTDLAALLAHIRSLEAEREEFLKLLVETKAAVDGMPKRIADGVQPLIKAEIAAAVARERERAAVAAWTGLMAACKRHGLSPAMHNDLFAVCAAIREPKP